MKWTYQILTASALLFGVLSYNFNVQSQPKLKSSESWAEALISQAKRDAKKPVKLARVIPAQPISVAKKIPVQTHSKKDTRLNPLAIQAIAKQPQNKDYTFIVTGDNRNGDAIFKQILKQSAKDDPRFMIHTGDFISGGFQNEYKTFISHLSHSAYPVISTIGNHEIYNGGRKWYDQYFGPGHFSYRFGPDKFILLDNANAKIGPEQLAWFESELKKPSRYTFVAMHMPPRNFIWFHAFSEGANAMRDLAEKYKVNYVLLGHMHIYDKMVSNGVNYVISGGAGAPLYRMPLYISPKGQAFNHYLKMEISDQGIKEVIVPVKF